MNRGVMLVAAVTLCLCGCGTYAGEGAVTGATFGTILGSAIGGIAGGPRGSDVGTLVGMAGGAVVGAAVGSEADRAQQEEYRRYMEEREARYSRKYRPGQDVRQTYGGGNADESGFDPTNSGDDRIVMEQTDGSRPDAHDNVYSTVTPRSVSVEQLSAVAPGYTVNYNDDIEVRNVSFVDRDRDGVIRRGEECKVTFEIMNRSDVTLYDVQPTVVETTGNKYIHVSPPLHVESIEPGKGVRYTATVYADSRLKDGNAVIKVAVAQGNREITSQVKEFNIVTRKK